MGLILIQATCPGVETIQVYNPMSMGDGLWLVKLMSLMERIKKG